MSSHSVPSQSIAIADSALMLNIAVIASHARQRNRHIDAIFYAVFLLLAGVTTAHAGERDTYEYKLIESKDDNLCKHMETVYNTDFKRPFDIVDPKTVDLRIKRINALGLDLPPLRNDSLSLYKLLYTFYPTSPEFDAVKWEYKTYEGRYAPQPIVVAKVDIDNDGVPEVVIKTGFLHDPKGFDTFTILPLGAFDTSKTSFSLSDVLRGNTEKSSKASPRYIDSAIQTIFRIFRFDNKTYLHAYRFCEGMPEGQSCGMFQPHESVHILKYLGGGEHLPVQNLPEFDNVCTYRITTIPAYTPTPRK